jgi:hypothetical protein
MICAALRRAAPQGPKTAKRPVCVGTADPARGRGVMAVGSGEPNLSAFQQQVARLFFALPASQGYG